MTSSGHRPPFQLLFFLVGLVGTTVLHAASPVRDGLRLHLDGSDIDGAGNGPLGDPSHGGSVSVWGDASGSGLDLRSVSGRPVLLSDGVSGRPAVQFDPGDDYLERPDILGGLSGNPSLDVFVVLQAEDSQAFLAFGTGLGGQTKQLTTETAFRFQNGDRQFAGATLVGQGPVIGNFLVPSSPTYGTHRFFRNGAEATATAVTNPTGWTLFPATGGVTRIGSGIGAGGGTDGDFADLVAEVLVYDRQLNGVERVLVLNYLSARYDIALDGAALDRYEGDSFARGDLDEDVAGIGREAGVAVTAGASAGLRLVDATFLVDDGDSVLCGHSSLPNLWVTTELGSAPTVASRMQREWFVDVTDVGTTGGAVGVAFDFRAAGLASPTASESYRLLVRQDLQSDFTELGGEPSIDEGSVVFAGVEASDLAGRYVTVGSSAETPLSATAVISELVASNLLGMEDSDGDSSDWIEIHNTSLTDILDISGWYLTDDVEEIQKWAFPSGTVLGPDGRLVVFASGKNRAGNELHANFQLQAGGEYLALVQGDTVVYEYAPTYPPQYQDVAFGIPQGGGEPTFLSRPTPGAANAPMASLGPQIDAVAHFPARPTAADTIVVTASVLPLLGQVDSVSFRYRVLYGAESGAVAMNDTGSGADLAAGDGVFTGVIPSSVFGAGDMIRWVVTAVDAEGNATRSPPFPDSQASPQYHGTVTVSSAEDSSLPVFYWFLAPGTEGAANTRTGTRASVAFLGQLYDNVFVRLRGGTTAGLAKKSYKFDFNPGDHLRFDPEFGRVSEINLNTTYTDKTYLRQDLAFEIFDAAGCPGSESFLVRIERNGEFFSVAAFVEQPDDDLLRREGLGDEGALYKMYNAFTSASSVEKKNRHWENNADLESFISSMNGRSGDALRTYVFDTVNVPVMLSYLTANVLTQNNDCMAKNYYLYRDSDGTGEWSMLPWDVDLSFGRHFMTDDSILGDTLWADEDTVLGGSGRNVPISPSHPFVGRQTLPGNRNWNRLMDALFEVPDFTEMFRRRLRTLIDQILQPPGTPEESRWIEARMAEIAEQIGTDSELDVARWGQYGQRQSLAAAIDVLKSQYLDVRRVHLFETHLADNADAYPEPRAYSAELPGAQNAPGGLEIVAVDYSPATGNQDEEYVAVRNSNAFAVDVSGWRLEGGVEFTFRPSTVLLGGQTLYASPHVPTFRARGTSPSGGEGLFVQGEYAGHLSSLGETVCLIDDQDVEQHCFTYEGSPSDAQRYLRITEVHYHPAFPSEGEFTDGFTDAELFEFVELTNSSESVTLNLDGVYFDQGIQFRFSSGGIRDLGPGEVVLVVSSRAAFERRYGTGFPIAGEYAPSRLDNGGETIKLEDPTNSTIAEFRYDDDPALGWPALADGLGPSLEVVSLEGSYDDPANWRASVADHGSPGSYTPVDGEPVFIRGDANLDGVVDITDAVSTLLYLFQGRDSTCIDSMDSDDDEDVNITDAIRVLGYLFQGGAAPPAPFPAPGHDPTGDALDCQSGL